MLCYWGKPQSIERVWSDDDYAFIAKSRRLGEEMARTFYSLLWNCAMPYWGPTALNWEDCA